MRVLVADDMDSLVNEGHDKNSGNAEGDGDSVEFSDEEQDHLSNQRKRRKRSRISADFSCAFLCIRAD